MDRKVCVIMNIALIAHDKKKDLMIDFCIAYKNIVKPSDHLCSVVIEPENEPIKIEDTVGYLNEYVGNTKTFGDAVTMLIEYLKRYEA